MFNSLIGISKSFIQYPRSLEAMTFGCIIEIAHSFEINSGRNFLPVNKRYASNQGSKTYRLLSVDNYILLSHNLKGKPLNKGIGTHFYEILEINLKNKDNTKSKTFKSFSR